MYIDPVERKFLKKSKKSDYVKTELDITLDRVTSSVGDIKDIATDLTQKVEEKLVEVDDALVTITERVDSVIMELQNIEIPQGEKGDKGEDGATPDVQAITEDVLSRIPSVDEEQIISKVLNAIPENKPSLKVIQESIDKEALLEDIINSPKFKIKTSNVEGLDLNLKALDKRYIHGGGDTVVAGTNVTITRNTNGDKVINATAVNSFESVSANLSAYDNTLNYDINGDVTSIVYSNGVTKTFNYTGEDITSIVLSGATPSGISLTKTLIYTDGNVAGITYT